MKKEDYIPSVFAWISLGQATAETRLMGIFLLHGADELKKEHGQSEPRSVLVQGQESPRVHAVG